MEDLPPTCRQVSRQDLRALTTRAEGEMAHGPSAPSRQQVHKIRYLGGESPELRPNKLPRVPQHRTPFAETKNIPTEWRAYHTTLFLRRKHPTKPGVVAQTWNPITEKAEAQESQVGNQPGLHSEFQGSLGYSRILSQEQTDKLHPNKREAHKSRVWWIVWCNQWSSLNWRSPSGHTDLWERCWLQVLVPPLSPPTSITQRSDSRFGFYHNHSTQLQVLRWPCFIWFTHQPNY